MLPALVKYSEIEYRELPYISAGFPSPAHDDRGCTLDIHEYLIENPVTTFTTYMNNADMTTVGLFLGDLLIVDRSLKLRPYKIILAQLDGTIIVRRYTHEQGRGVLKLDNRPSQREIITADRDFLYLGRVTYVIHPV